MKAKPKCPFCLREFETVEQVTQHLIFDNCKVERANPPSGNGGGNQPAPQSNDIVPEPQKKP